MSRLCRDTRWTEGGGSFEIQIALATFGILALELAVIRWTSSQIRIFAYFKLMKIKNYPDNPVYPV